MTCKDNVPVNFEAIDTIEEEEEEKKTMENYFRTGHEKQEIVCLSITTPFYDTEPT